MGIRFHCHLCDRELHVKDFLAGKKGRCPACDGRFRVPNQDAPKSLAVGEPAGVSQSETHAGRQSSSVASTTKAAPATPQTKQAASTQSTNDRHAKPKPKSKKTNSAGNSARPQSHADSGSVRGTADSGHAKPAFNARMPQALAEAPSAVWYVRPPAGGQYGPANFDAFYQWLTEDRVTRDSLVWRDDWPDWQSAELVFSDFFGQANSGQPVTPSATHKAGPSVPTQEPEISPSPEPSLVDSANLHARKPDESATQGQPAASATAANAATPANPGTNQPQTSNTSTPTLSERNRLGRRQRKRRNYTIMLAVLSVVTIILIVCLVFAIMQQN